MISMGRFYLEYETLREGASGLIGAAFALAAIAGNEYLKQTGVLGDVNSSLLAFALFIALGVAVTVITSVRKRKEAASFNPV